MQLRKTVDEMNMLGHFGRQSLSAMQTENLHTRRQTGQQARQAVFYNSTVFRGAIQCGGNVHKQCRIGFEAAHFGRTKQTFTHQISQSGDAQGQLGFLTRSVGSYGKRYLQFFKRLQQNFGTRNFL